MPNKNVDYFYHNIVINNNGDGAIEAKIKDDKLIPVIDAQEEWKLSVLRFKVPLYLIPLFKFNETVDWYQITLRFESMVDPVEITVPVLWLNDDGVNLNNEKNIYYYSQFLHMVNSCLYTAWEALVNAVFIQHRLITLSHFSDAPKIIYNSDTKLFSFVLPIKNVGAPAPNPNLYSVFDFDNEIWDVPPANDTPIANNYHRVSIIFNNKLFNFFNGFPALKIDNNNNQFDYQMLIYDNPGNRYPGTYFNELAPPAIYLMVKADYPCLYSWHRVSRIIFMTNMSIMNENVTNNELIGQPNHVSILTDYEIPQSDQTNREYLYYYNNSYDRYINITGVGPLRTIDFSVFYEMNDGTYSKLYLPPTSDLYLKLQFKRIKEHN